LNLNGDTDKMSSKTEQPKTNAPKNPKTAFLLFCVDMRPATLKEVNLEAQAKNEPPVHPSQITVILSERWAKMTELEKKPWRDRAEEDRQRYIREKAIYSPSATQRKGKAPKTYLPPAKVEAPVVIEPFVSAVKDESPALDNMLTIQPTVLEAPTQPQFATLQLLPIDHSSVADLQAPDAMTGVESTAQSTTL